jgi:O-antigen ligase
MRLRRTRRLKPAPTPYPYLGALSLILAYAAFQSGGIVALEWDRCLVALGLVVLVYFRFTSKDDLAPALQPWLKWPPLLLLAFIMFQLVPLPLWLLRAVSPARSTLAQSLQPILPGNGFAPISVYPSATLAHLLRAAAYTAVFLLARELAWRTLERRWLIIAPVVIVAGVEAVWGLLQYSPDSVAHGTYVNRNHFAGLLELSLPFAVVYPIAALKKRGHESLRQAALISISVALAALMVLGIVLSLSRTGFVASFASLLLIGLLAPDGRVKVARRFATAGFVTAALIAGSLYLAPDPLISRFGEVSETPTDLKPDTRTRIWKDTLALVADYPLAGCGLGAFEQAFPRYRTFLPQLAVNTVHNDYLQFLSELGVIGFAIAVAGMIVVFLSAAFAVFHSGDSATSHVAIASVAALAAILIHSFTDYNLYIPANAMVVAWIAGVVASLNFGSRELSIT